MKRRNSYSDWARLLKKHGEETTNSYVPIIGTLPHPSERGFKTIEAEEQ